MPLSPPFVSRTFIAAVLAIGPLGCASASQPIDERRAAEQMTAAERQMQQDQQQPRSNPRYQKQVYPQPAEDPLNTGRDLER